MSRCEDRSADESNGRHNKARAVMLAPQRQLPSPLYGEVFADLATFGDSVAVLTRPEDGLDEGTIERQLHPMQLPGHWNCPFQLSKLCRKAAGWWARTSDGRQYKVDPLPSRLRSLPANKPPFWTPTRLGRGFWSAGIQSLRVPVEEDDVIIAAASDGVFDNILIEAVVARADEMWCMTAAKLAREIGELAYNTSVDRTAPTPFAREARIHIPNDPDFKDGLGGKKDDITVVVGVVRSPGRETETVCDPYGEAAEDAEREEDLSPPSRTACGVTAGKLARGVDELAYKTSLDCTAATPFAQEAAIHIPDDPDFFDGITVVVAKVGPG
ncbi:unnamed protein product [Vitrella brassicaformis CCMP3155]|uniref:Protein phosphatase n=1 Tax=Vitrella brassicaformis (strain CCMP3155) TaxID=1169540 RepID=A0A0G4FWE4_VITBC|nr:unnamed protein product [Vitrella brassicaformis CCMP3155]|eukprot:CEM19448.1 unnamed protein product [Vitrella brassicaformis CCMP3155]